MRAQPRYLAKATQFAKTRNWRMYVATFVQPAAIAVRPPPGAAKFQFGRHRPPPSVDLSLSSEDRCQADFRERETEKRLEFQRFNRSTRIALQLVTRDADGTVVHFRPTVGLM